MKKIKVAYCTGFWCTNIGNGFFSLGVEHVLKKILGNDNVTIVSDFQTYTNAYGKRLFPDKNQLEYISKLKVDYIVLAGPVISKYFLRLWKDIIIELNKKGIGYIILSAGIMKMDNKSKKECERFFAEYPPYIFSSRDLNTYETFGKYAINAYNGICFSFFAPNYYKPCKIEFEQDYWVLNFDKIKEPKIVLKSNEKTETDIEFLFENLPYIVKGLNKLNSVSSKTDRFTDAIIYASSLLPEKKKPTLINNYKIIRTDQRFHPHYRSKIYKQSNSFCADIPYGYLNIYANSKLTLSDRVHSCAITLAYGNSAMLFAKTNRVGLLERVGAKDINIKPVKLDLKYLEKEKSQMISWLRKVLDKEGE